MGINIGNNNTIKNSNIVETVNGTSSPNSNNVKSFYERHPVICSFLISLIAGVVVLFSFWNNIIKWIEGWF